MARKTFKDNPAVQFISGFEAEVEKMETEIAPATAAVQAPEGPPEGYKLNPLYVEKKSRRMQLVLQPSLYEKVRAHAVTAGVSVNEYVHAVLEKATQE